MARGGTKKTPATVEVLLKCLEAGMPVDRSCDFAKIDRKTFYNWIAKDKELSTRVRFARAKVIKSLVGMVAIKDPWKILRSLDPKNFNDQVTLFHGEHEVDEEMEAKSDDELRKGAG